MASLVKILNDNFGVKVSEKTINRVYMHIILNGQRKYWDQNLMKGSRKVESSFAFITFIWLIIQDMCTLMNLIFI